MVNTLFLLSDATSSEKIELQPTDSEEAIIGGIILNRIVGIAYDKLNIHDLNKETIRCMKFLKDHYDHQYNDFILKLRYVSSIFEDADYRCSFLKGAFVIPTLYKPGQRISNDIDLLIDANDVSKAHSHLTKHGFIQGYCDTQGRIVPATRREIIESKMNYGETVPYLRYYKDKLVEIDLNFSIDFKAKGTRNIVSSFLSRSEKVTVFENIEIPTLSTEDFLIHLCCHLFKEATTYDWLVHRRDLMLYKFSDINLFLNKFATSLFLSHLMSRVKELGMEKECYFTFFNTTRIFSNILKISEFQSFLNKIKPESTDYMYEINYPSKKITYKYELSFEDWFMSTNRISLLKEVIPSK